MCNPIIFHRISAASAPCSVQHEKGINVVYDPASVLQHCLQRAARLAACSDFRAANAQKPQHFCGTGKKLLVLQMTLQTASRCSTMQHE
jgi:hypothetical protein